MSVQCLEGRIDERARMDKGAMLTLDSTNLAFVSATMFRQRRLTCFYATSIPSFSIPHRTASHTSSTMAFGL